MKGTESPPIEYNPYDFRQGHITNFDAFIHLIKCSFGTGVLAMPMGFKHAGIVPAFILGVIIGVLCVYCLNLLIRCMIVVATQERIPYARVQDAAKYTFSSGSRCTRFLAPHLSWITSTILCVYHLGICVAYINYIVEVLLEFVNLSEYAEGRANLQRFVAMLISVAALFLINCIRDLKTLSPISTLGNIFTLISMCMILYFIFVPDGSGFSNDYRFFGAFNTMPLYIGIILFAVESFGVVLAVEKDMIQPAKFLGTFGVFYVAMTIVVVWYLFLGFVGYLKYGQRVESTIALTIPGQTLAKVMQGIVAVTLYCSFPLQCFTPIDVLWNQNLGKKVKKNALWWEFGFRFCLTLLVGLIGLLIPSLDIIISLVGCVCLTLLGIILPSAMEFNLNYALFAGVWNLVMIKDLCILVFGIFAFAMGLYASLESIIFYEKKLAE